MKESVNNLNWYFNQYDKLVNEIKDLDKAVDELNRISDVNISKLVVLDKLNEKKAELQRLKDLKVSEV